MDSDERFKHLAKDPRFKKLKRREVKVDERFQAKFTDERFTGGNRDKRGWDDSHESSSSDESESDEEPNVKINEIKYDWQPLDDDAEKGEATSRRLAIQNLDWDLINAKDIFTLVNSIRPPLNVRIYVSEFGKDRLAREEKEGPEELVEMSKVDEDEEELKRLEARMKMLEEQESKAKTHRANEYEDADEVLDPENEELRERIRRYQLSKMKYYYAIAEFDSAETAEAVYKELDGMEYEGSSLELDLRFVPDDMTFDPEDMRAECNKAPDQATYKAPQFISSALQQTTVKFTWDETDARRQEKLRKAYTKEEIEKDDLDAYLASETETESDDSGNEQGGDNDKFSVITGNSEARANKYKMLLQSLDEEAEGKKKVDVDVVWGDYEEDEAAVAGAQTGNKSDADGEEDDDDDDENEDDDDLSSDGQISEHDNSDELEMSEDQEEEKEAPESPELERGSGNSRRKARGKGKKTKQIKNQNGDSKEGEDLDLLLLDVNAPPKDEFKFNPDDERFGAIYSSAHHNIDPSHPNFKRTGAFEQIAEKKRQKRRKQ